MRKLPQSVPISYRDIDKSISLKCYADTIVFLKENNRRTLVAVRFGGYPEQVRGMSDAMYGGISFEAEFEQGRAVIYSEKKRYRRKTSHDGIYAESVLVMLDDEKSNTTENEDEKENTKQRKFIFCKVNDKDTLFSEIDKKVSILLISEFKDFIIDELLKSKILVPLEVFSREQSFDVYMLCMKNDESDVIEIVNRGLRQGEISIPNSHLSQDNFDNINSVSQYLNKYGTVIAERIKGSFLPLYDPANEDVCDSLKRINAHLKNHTGYELYSAQLAVAESVKRRLENAKTAMVIAECGSGKYLVKATQFFFLKETDKNHKCSNCGANLWTAYNPDDYSKYHNRWVKIGNYGYIYRDKAIEHIGNGKNAKINEKIRDVIENPNKIYPAIGAYRRYSLSEYIAQHIQVDGLICDELHQYKGESGQGNAMANLVGCSNKVIGMTATLVNGYSSGMFYLLYRIAPNLMIDDNKSYTNPRAFNDEYGVTEEVFECDDSEYNNNSRCKKRKIRERQLPGVSPLVYSRFLIESAVFLSLNDMGKDLPDYEEIPVELSLHPDVMEEYKRIEDTLIQVLRKDKAIARKVMSQ